MLDNIRSGYARLVPTGEGDDDNNINNTMNAVDADIIADLGIYEDEESSSRRQEGEFGESTYSILGNYSFMGGRNGASCTGTCHRRFTEWLEAIMDRLPELSFREKLLGCGTCMVCGYLLSFGSFLRLSQLFTGNPVPLVVHVTMGNIIALCGTCFLTGPSSQVSRMFAPSRSLASTYYLGSLAVTIFLLVLPRFIFRGLLLFLLMIGQYVAITWYCLSYIPFARNFISTMVTNRFGGTSTTVGPSSSSSSSVAAAASMVTNDVQ